MKTECVYARLRSITCAYTCVHLLLNKFVHIQCIHGRTNSISSVEHCNGSSRMRSTQENHCLLLCLPPAPSTLREACNDMHTWHRTSLTLNHLGTNANTYLKQRTLGDNANVQLEALKCECNAAMCAALTQLYNTLHNILVSAAAHLAICIHTHTHACRHAHTHTHSKTQREREIQICTNASNLIFFSVMELLPLISASCPWAACIWSSFSSLFGFYWLSLMIH